MSDRVLVVDDDKVVRELLQVILDKAGYDTRQASGGAEALKEIASGSFSAILLDLMMPGVNGYEVLSTLAREHPELKCVVLLSAAPPQELEHADMTVVHASLQKPFEMDELRGTVEACVLANHAAATP